MWELVKVGIVIGLTVSFVLLIAMAVIGIFTKKKIQQQKEEQILAAYQAQHYENIFLALTQYNIFLYLNGIPDKDVTEIFLRSLGDAITKASADPSIDLSKYQIGWAANNTAIVSPKVLGEMKGCQHEPK